MSIDLGLSLVIAAVASSAMVAASSLDQSVKQLPTRRRIGVLAYSDYSLVADARKLPPVVRAACRGLDLDLCCRSRGGMGQASR